MSLSQLDSGIGVLNRSEFRHRIRGLLNIITLSNANVRRTAGPEVDSGLLASDQAVRDIILLLDHDRDQQNTVLGALQRDIQRGPSQ